MRRANPLALASLALVAQAGAQGLAPAVPRPISTGIRQLGALHYPRGEAAQSDVVRAIGVDPWGRIVVGRWTRGALCEPNAGVDDVVLLWLEGDGRLR